MLLEIVFGPNYHQWYNDLYFSLCFGLREWLAMKLVSLSYRCNNPHSLQSSNDNVFQIPIFTAILIYGIFDIFLAMYLANDIDVASDKLSYRLFESGWIGQPKSCIKCLLILGETVRHSQQLVILKIYPMNLETFIVVRTWMWNLECVSSIDFLLFNCYRSWRVLTVCSTFCKKLIKIVWSFRLICF